VERSDAHQYRSRSDGYRFAPPILRGCDRRPAAVSLHFFPLPLLAFAKALRDCRSPGDQRGLVRQALREIGVVALYDVEHGFLGKLPMVIGKEFVKVSELFVVHGFRASAAIAQIYRNLLIPCQLLTRLVTLWERILMVVAAPRRRNRRSVGRLLTIC
jgi:hypothetical protein